MANLLSTHIAGDILSKDGTAPSGSTTDRLTDLFNGSPASNQYASLSNDSAAQYKMQQMQMDPYNAGSFIVIYWKVSVNTLYARMGTITDTTITWASQGEVQIVSNPGGEGVWGPQIAFDPSTPNKFIAVYQVMSGSTTGLKVGTVEPKTQTISFAGGGGCQRFYGGGIAFDPNTPGRFVLNGINYQNYPEQAICGLINYGTSNIGFGSVFNYTANQGGYGQTYSRCIFNPNVAGRLLVIWSDKNNNEGNDPHIGYARTLGISGQTISATSSTTQYETNGDGVAYHAVAWDPHNATKFIISYQTTHNGVGYGRVGTMAANGDLSFGARSVFDSNQSERTWIEFDPGIPGKFLIAYNSGSMSSRTGKVVVGTYSGGTTITSWGTPQAFNSTQTNAVRSCCIDFDPNRPGKFLIQNQEGSQVGKVRAGKINENSLSIDFSSGDVFTLDMENVAGTIDTFTVTNVPSGANEIFSFTLNVTQAAGQKQFDWGGKITNVKWANPPRAVSVSSAENKVDLYSFTTWDNGTSWYGKVIGQNYG